MRETLTRVLRSYGLARGESAAGLLSHPSKFQKTDCAFDPDVWDHGEQHILDTSGIGRVVLSRLPATDRMRLSRTDGALPAWRAVIDLPQDTTRSALKELHDIGVRGIRFDVGATADSLDEVLKIADRIVPFGWHLELRLGAAGSARALAKAEWRLMQFPLAVCFAGIGGAPRDRSTADLDFLLGMVQLGRFWLKLSGNDLAPPQLKLWDEPPPLARALIAVRKDRLLWGSGRKDATDRPSYVAASLALLEKCLPHPGDQQQVLVDNPARLYDF